MTSFPWIAAFTSGSTVSPLSGLPLVIIAALWFVPLVIRGSRISRLAYPLIVFASIALLSSALSLFASVEPFVGQTIPSRPLRAGLSLIIGIGFYLVVSKFPWSEKRLRESLRWLYLGGAVMLLWSSVQVYLLLFESEAAPSYIREAHRILSIRDLGTTRVTGMAFEPSWLANLLVVLFIPLWLASVISRYSITRIHARIVSIELFMLLWGSIILFFTFSRIGLLSFFAVIAFLGFLMSWRLASRWTVALFDKRKGSVSTLRKFGTGLIRWLILGMLSLLAFLAMIAVLYAAGNLDDRIGRLFRVSYIGLLSSGNASAYLVARSLAFSERLTYWTTAFRIFSEFPILGVGLGNTGFYFTEMVPSYGYGLPEIIRTLTGDVGFPNAKNLWIRLLAETGIMGFLAFLLWLLVLARAAWLLHNRANGIIRVLGTAGMLALVAQIFEGFSLDTFALPQLWIVLGLVTAAFSIWEYEALRQPLTSNE
ncbi:MAG: O-antigen ligase family protein [Chloroflexi bacterium]|nr:O-antigen ligase family protein [Chloroflexota bacterium]